MSKIKLNLENHKENLNNEKLIKVKKVDLFKINNEILRCEYCSFIPIILFFNFYKLMSKNELLYICNNQHFNKNEIKILFNELLKYNLFYLECEICKKNRLNYNINFYYNIIENNKFRILCDFHIDNLKKNINIFEIHYKCLIHNENVRFYCEYHKLNLCIQCFMSHLDCVKFIILLNKIENQKLYFIINEQFINKMKHINKNIIFIEEYLKKFNENKDKNNVKEKFIINEIKDKLSYYKDLFNIQAKIMQNLIDIFNYYYQLDQLNYNIIRNAQLFLFKISNFTIINKLDVTEENFDKIFLNYLDNEDNYLIYIINFKKCFNKYIDNQNKNKKVGYKISKNDNYIYYGNINNNKKEGFGILYDIQFNRLYEGEFKDNKINGNGIMYYSNGSYSKDKFENNNQIENGEYCLKYLI